MSTFSPSERIKNLDLLRALAILLVIYFHTTQMVYGKVIDNKAIYNLGKFGVNFFFVLSGFLITRIYLKDITIHPGKFWAKRFLRIYPPYIITLIGSWIAVSYARDASFDWGYIFMIQNFYIAIPFFLVSWSLCVEEHFYLIYTIVIFFTKNLKAQLFFWISLCIIPCICRYFITPPNVDTFGYYTTATYLQMDSIAFGVLAAYFIEKQGMRLKISSGLIFVFIIPTLFVCYILSSYENQLTLSLGQSLLNIMITMVLIALYYAKPLSIANLKFVKFNAQAAFSIYLIHPICIHLSMVVYSKLGISNLYVLHFGMITAIYVAAYAFHRSIEMPSIKFRDRLKIFEKKSKIKYA